MSEELVDVVDSADRVVGSVRRSRLRDSALNYRVVHVLVINSRGELLLQRMPESKHAGFSWGSSVAGHVQTGESYHAAAAREFEEELGARPQALRSVGTTWLDDGVRRKFIGVFVDSCDGPFRPDPFEVGALEYHRLPEVRRLLREDRSAFSATFERVFRLVDAEDGWPR